MYHEATESLTPGAAFCMHSNMTCLFHGAPIGTNLILSYIAEHVPGPPRSY